MSSGFYDRFETQHGKSRSKDNEIYVSGIPIDLDKAGLENIFIKAGTIESVRIIPPKIANSTTTFGFVTYKHRTSAALAIETFNLFKFNGKTFTVRYSDNAQQSASTSSSTMRSSAFMTPAPSNSQINGDDIPNSTFIETPISIANKSLDVSKINVSTLIDSNIMNIDELHKRSSMGRGVFHQSKNQKGPVFNTMRPYARRLYQSRTHLSNTSIESDTSVSLISRQQQQQLKTPSVTNHLPIKSSNSVNSYKQATLTVGETYQINITHVNSPANFFIHLAASLSKKADFINNLDNYYRNDLSTNEKDEFCDMDAGAIRCKLYNIEPVSGREWCPSSIELLNSLQKTQDETLEVKVYSCDNYNQPETGRIEKIYAVDILFGGEDSVIDYMLSNNLAKVATNIKQEPLKTKDLNIPVTQPVSVPVTSTTASKPPLPHSNKVINNSTLIQAKKCAQVKLTKNEIYTVFLQHFDDSYQDQYFYLTLHDQASKMTELENFIQLDKSTNLIYIQALNDIKLDDYSLEALFDVDEKWYRVKATNIGQDSVDIYFLDYGNTQRLTESEIVKNKMLRRRIAYQDQKEAKLFSLEYQAVKCVHLVEKRFALKALLEKLSAKTDLDTIGFDIIVDEIKNDVCSIQLFDITTPTTPNLKSPAKLVSTAGYDETDNDDVFSDTNSITNQKLSMLADTNSEMSILLSVNTTLDGSIMHVVSTNEFYIQSQENLKQLIDHQCIIKTLANLSVNMDFKSIRGQPAHQVGDICLAKYLCDSTWYRGVVMKVNVVQQLDEGYSYDVFFADYGNIESQMPGSLVLSMQCVRNAIKCSKKNSLENDLMSLVELPFMAICCQLDQRKECIRNTEILKTLMFDCPVFTFRVKQIKDHYLLNDNKQLKIKKYIINLYSNGELLDESFETQPTALTQTPTPIPALPIAKVETVCIPLNELKPYSCHEFKLAHLDSETEIYFNLYAHLGDLEALQIQINADEEIISKSRSVNLFKLDDLVLAKFMNENDTFDWYRARIIGINDSVYQVFYIDYGNVDDSLSIADLRPLPEKFMKQAQFAYKMRLNGIDSLDLDANDVIIGEYFLGEGFKLKVISRQDDYYLVELWNKEMTECLNKILEPKYSIAIEKKQHQINSSFLNDKFTAAQSKSSNSSLRVTTGYILMEDFQRPLYFCLKENIEQRNLLSDRLNEHYNKSASISSKFHPKLNDYCVRLYEGSWFRAQIKNIDEKKLHLFHIDYAYEETIEEKDYNQTLRALSEEFMAEPRYIFGAYLLKPNSTECIQFNENEVAELADCLEVFFIDDDLDLIVQQKQTNSVHFSNEFYFGVQILNSQNTSLNQILVEKKQEIERKKKQLKPALPDYIRLKSSDMPVQRETLQPNKSDSYMLFSKHVDLFYIFEENQVLEMQRTVQAVCEKIMSERGQFSIEENSKDSLRFLPNKGDLVYAKYDDNAWYRCLVTNCNQSRNKYELFFVDFGNTELTSNEEILQGWTDEHMKPFRDVAPLSFKCKLYGLTTTTANEAFTDEQNAFFKKHTSDRLFGIKLVKFNADDNIFEICLRGSSQTSWLKFHEILIENKIAQFKPVLKALHAELQTIESINEIEFYSELINSIQKA